MSKAVIQIGYKEYVLEAEKAIRVLEMLDGAEIFREKYNKGVNTFHVYPAEPASITHLKILPDALYNMAKLAGKPEED